MGVLGRESVVVAFLTGVDPGLVGMLDFLGLGVGLMFVFGVIGLVGVIAVAFIVVVAGTGARVEIEAGGEVGDGTEAVVSTGSAVVVADATSTTGVAIGLASATVSKVSFAGPIPELTTLTGLIAEGAGAGIFPASILTGAAIASVEAVTGVVESPVWAGPFGVVGVVLVTVGVLPVEELTGVPTTPGVVGADLVARTISPCTTRRILISNNLARKNRKIKATQVLLRSSERIGVSLTQKAGDS